MSNRKWIGMAVIGAGLGIAVSFLIAFWISAALGDGNFYPVSQELLAASDGNQMRAVGTQTIVSAAYGAICTLLSQIWHITSWGLLKQTAVFFPLLFAAALISGYIAGWIPYSSTGLVRYILIFVGIFAAIWVIEYFAGRSRVRRMNENLRRAKAKSDR